MIALLFVAIGCLGMGNGAVFQLVPQRFADRMGLVTGIVGAAGGLGRILPAVDARRGQGLDRQLRRRGCCCCAIVFAGGALALLHLGSVWASRWQPDIVSRSGVFCYRERGPRRGRASR